MRLRLLPGERELVRLRPSSGAYLGHYVLALGFVLWGLACAAAFSSTAWTDSTQGRGASAAAVLLAMAGPVLLALVLFLPRRRYVALALTLAAAGAAAGAILGSNPSAGVVWAYAVASLVALVVVEVDRRSRLYHFTNLRIVYYGRVMDRRGWKVHYDAVLDLDGKQGPLARILGYGTIEPIMRPENKRTIPPKGKRKVQVPNMVEPEDYGIPPKLWGVAPFAAVRRLMETFVMDATATSYVRDDQATRQKAGHAMDALRHANLMIRN